MTAGIEPTTYFPNRVSDQGVRVEKTAASPARAGRTPYSNTTWTPYADTLLDIPRTLSWDTLLPKTPFGYSDYCRVSLVTNQ